MKMKQIVWWNIQRKCYNRGDFGGWKNNKIETEKNEAWEESWVVVEGWMTQEEEMCSKTKGWRLFELVLDEQIRLSLSQIHNL